MAHIGVLAVQGAFARHADVLRALSHDVSLVRAARDFDTLEGLVLPGGESTVQLDLIGRFGLEVPLRELIARGVPVLATCAGLILLAKTVESPAQPSFGALDVDLTRNAWGRQLDSFEAQEDSEAGLPLIFIRAPRITRVGPTVEVLARYRGEPVLVRERNITAATFHPELSRDPRVHAAVFGVQARPASDHFASG
ncbi:MAG TPA: pyridoxal 5'-phosphate synthase glutaminase subunit PdxT [Polyangiales bacterium]|nr:pyridoxal 5'-phosphate synthase glutaminase subunit PdxT [Polyangiales bacterium]